MLFSIRNENTDVSNKQQLSINVYGLNESQILEKVTKLFCTPAITNYTTVSARNVFARFKLLESKI